jgi:hypothetical protein
MKEDYKYVLCFHIHQEVVLHGTGITIQLWIVTVDILDIKEKAQPFDLTHSVYPLKTMQKFVEIKEYMNYR